MSERLLATVRYRWRKPPPDCAFRRLAGTATDHFAPTRRRGLNYRRAEADQGCGTALCPSPTETGFDNLSWLRAAARPTAIVLGLGIGVAGCRDRAGRRTRGWMAPSRPVPRPCPFDLIDLTPTTVVAYRPEPADRSTLRRPAASRPADVRCGGAGRRAAGARLRTLRRQHLPDHPAAGRRPRHPARDRQTARSMCPMPGTVKVAGLDLTQIEQRIASQLAGKAQDPGHRGVRRRPHATPSWFLATS